jgi:hypothetical protein
VTYLEVKKATITDFQINCNGHLIKSKSSIKYLGVDIDQNLSGERTAKAIHYMIPVLYRILRDKF